MPIARPAALAAILAAALAPTIPPARAGEDPAKPAPAAPPAKPAPAAPGIPADTEVKTMPSGLKYCVLKDGGAGAMPRLGDKVRVHYTGWLVDGKEFDSSRSRGAPTEFFLGQVIEGWNQALAAMTVGSRWKITIPPELGYGDGGAPPVIPPKATLIFDVELLSFKGAPAFRRPDAAAQKTTASGLRYEVLAPGEGDTAGEEDAFEMAYTIYGSKGDVFDCSDLSGNPIVGRRQDMRLGFLKEAPGLVKKGGEVLLEVTPAQWKRDRALGKLAPDETTYWRIRLVRVGRPRPAPAFEMPAKEKLETTASGLQIWIVKPGEGESPAMGDGVVVDYAGWLLDGTLFDDSYSRGMPATFPVGGLIPGWNEALQRLKPGAVAWLVIPSALGYGTRGQGAKIPPNSVLVFKMELHEVRK